MVRKRAENVWKDADGGEPCGIEDRKVVMEVLEDPKNAQRWNIRCRKPSTLSLQLLAMSRKLFLRGGSHKLFAGLVDENNVDV